MRIHKTYYRSFKTPERMKNRPILNIIKTCFRKYFDFEGLARRREIGVWFLFLGAVFGVLFMAFLVVFGLYDENIISTETYEKIFEPILLAMAVFWAVTKCPTLAVMARRLRDAGLSPWYLLIPVGLKILSLWMLVQDSMASMSDQEPEVTIELQIPVYILTGMMLVIFFFIFFLSSKEDEFTGKDQKTGSGN